MKIKIFGKTGCAKCETTKNKVRHFMAKWDVDEKVGVTFYDMDTVDGMAEGAYNNVAQIPTTIVEKNDSVVARWDGEVPHSEKIKEHILS
ncbi:MAG: thioredoxin family protein [Candidatus Omnitrophica bacterium]|nr:thioredoxin family protein [Candidatus Omnitrophota bacterium]MBU4479004.1 thioredoxin family protein [Candidatus Omnitrophota bacterium]MCG2703799.1 thioredoxin family protein [Candidatus Omnitrophota bacterium]MCG2711298.1 thioredoxin family protein [Candidatus Omnitrophota bacterium]